MQTPQSPRTYTRLSLVALLALFVTGCPKVPQQTALMRETGRVTASAQELRTRMGEFGRRFATYIEVAADSVIQASDDAEIQRAAILLKLSAIPAAHDAALRADPLIAGIDTYAYLDQLRYFIDSPHGERIFGEYAFIIGDGLERAYVELARISDAVTNTDRDTVLVATLDEWVRDHPITDVPFVRPSIMGEAAGLLGASSGGIGQAFVSLEGSLDRIEQRVAYLSETAFKQAMWAGQIAVRNGLRMEEVTRFFDLMDASTNLMDTIPTILVEHRDAVIEALGAERFRVLLEIERLRNTTIIELKLEREIILDALREERALVMDALSEERAAVMASVDSLASRVVDRQYGVIDHMVWRLLQFAVVLGVLAMVWAMVFVRVIKR